MPIWSGVLRVGAASPPHFDPVLAHDYFNLVCITFLNLLNFFWLYTGDGFRVFWLSTSLYFL
jgi:hypothetical protein